MSYIAELVERHADRWYDFLFVENVSHRQMYELVMYCANEIATRCFSRGIDTFLFTKKFLLPIHSKIFEKGLQSRSSNFQQNFKY